MSHSGSLNLSQFTSENLQAGDRLSDEQSNVLQELYDQGNYAAAYHFVEGLLDTTTEEFTWFQIATLINGNFGHENAYTRTSNFLTDLIYDLDVNIDTTLEMDQQAVSDAIADKILQGILEEGKIPTIKEILDADAIAVVDDAGIPKHMWVGNSLIAKVMYPDDTEYNSSVVALLVGLLSGLAASLAYEDAGHLATELVEKHQNLANQIVDAINVATNGSLTADDLLSSDGQFIGHDAANNFLGGETTFATYNPNGSVNYYVNGDFEIGRTNPGSNYSQEFLDHYGHVTEDGTARASFGGHLKAFGDWIGLDGTFGIDGGFSDGGGGNHAKPVILDLDGDGIEISIEGELSFDWDEDGYKEQTSWAAEDDGFLVLDLNADGSRGAGDGKIDQARELAFALWGNDGDTDLQALARAFDGNNDGKLNSADAVWDELKIWQDLDQDGVTDAGELKSLADRGISEINLTYDDGSAYSDTDDDITVFGNTLLSLASFTMNGTLWAGRGVVNIVFYQRFAMARNLWGRKSQSQGIHRNPAECRRIMRCACPENTARTNRGFRGRAAQSGQRCDAVNLCRAAA